MARTDREILNEGNPNKLGDANKALQMGEAIALVPRTLIAPVDTNVMTLPETAKAAAVLSAYGQGGAAGYKAGVATGATPAAGEVAPDAGGNIEFAGADAITDAEAGKTWEKEAS